MPYELVDRATNAAHVIPPRGAWLTIGREPPERRTTSSGTSRRSRGRHAQLHEARDGVMLRVLSPNGVYKRGERGRIAMDPATGTKPEFPLHDGDQFSLLRPGKFDDDVAFFVRHVSAAAPAPPALVDLTGDDSPAADPTPSSRDAASEGAFAPPAPAPRRASPPSPRAQAPPLRRRVVAVAVAAAHARPLAARRAAGASAAPLAARRAREVAVAEAAEAERRDAAADARHRRGGGHVQPGRFQAGDPPGAGGKPAARDAHKGAPDAPELEPRVGAAVPELPARRARRRGDGERRVGAREGARRRPRRRVPGVRPRPRGRGVLVSSAPRVLTLFTHDAVWARVA